MSSLAQDELGHAAALYELLGDLTGARSATRSPTTVNPPSYRHARLLDHGRGDWAMTIARRYLYETADAVRLEALVDGAWAPLADLVGKIRREERYHVMHVTPWLERLATASGRAARPAASPRSRRSVRTPGPCSRRCPAKRPADRRGRPGRDRWPTSSAGGGRASTRPSSGCGLPLAAGDDATPNAGGPITASAFRWLHGEFTAVRARRPGCDVVTEHRAIGRAGRARGARDDPRPGDARSCRSSTSGWSTTRRRRAPTGSSVAILPTFIGCPALDVIRAVIADGLVARFGRPVRGRPRRFAVPWTTERITPAGSRGAAAGRHRPAGRRRRTCAARTARSADVVMDSAFGPTQCRSLFYCRECRQPFEAMKSV